MSDDADKPSIWDACMGDNTNTGMMRILAFVGAFVVAGGLIVGLLF
ncbi:hypothetical protein MRS76_01575 [Rhizobiaceae bacterium n13]|uniref:Uncharacterized protein n=1 Tax=Ferirhizobium litorale TaxID=2927786 RepID=A0AAE3QCD9_9HYPH|nr:hypothetical protein [Fererhizobium litorale]MDI7860633.1 hypothetical protein [Fererhizobium litorale]MDI7920781.1 hypothetical protein [Fererhizobium litorale]